MDYRQGGVGIIPMSPSRDITLATSLTRLWRQKVFDNTGAQVLVIVELKLR